MEVRPNPANKPARLKDALERSQRDLEDFFENGAVGLHWVASDGSILRVNQAELDLLGYTREEYVGRHIAEFHADNSVIDDILARLTRGEKLDKYAARLKAKDGSIKHVLISSNVHFHDGQFINTRCFTLDVTDLKKAETALRESEQRLRAMHERAFAGIAEVDLEGRFLRANARFCEITGYSADELLNCSFGSITHPDDVGSDLDNFAALQTDTYQIEKRFLRKDGTTIWVAVSASIVRDDHSQPLYGIRIVQDITELKRAQARQKLLLDELNHRVKNMLATVQSVAMQTRRRATDLDGFTQAFEGRLMALNRAHELLTREIGTGVLLRDLLLEMVAPYEDAAGERFRLRGPEIRLGPEVAVTLAMAFHELTTNAAKYGALSTPHGCVSIEWRSSAPDSLTIDWAETGGPPVVKPTRRGFGSDLIERGLARQFGGTAILDFNKAGVRCHIACMLPQRNDGIA
ncbi:PAS domain S-box protein [Bradyrhizobium sp. TZ2]